MEHIKFDFINKEYLLFLRLIKDKVEIGVIALEKEKLIDITDLEKEMILKNVINLDNETLDKIESKVNPKALVKIVQFISESQYIYCNTEMRKNFLEQNLKKYKYETEVVWKIVL